MSIGRIFVIIFYFFIFVSCSEEYDMKVMPIDKKYTMDIAYIEDPALPSIDPAHFFTIFKDELPTLTKEILGYDIEYNLKTGMSDSDFYRRTRPIFRKNAQRISEEHIDITKTSEAAFSSILYGRLLEEDYSRITNIFNKNIDKKTVERIIAPSIIDNIMTVWNTPLRARATVLNVNRYFMYTSLYWKIIASEYENASIIILNMPLADINKNISVKSMAEGGFVDRVIVYNENSKPSKATLVLSTYSFLSTDDFFSTKRSIKNTEVSVDILNYYILQSVAMMMKRYRVHENERYSIMAEVVDFDYNSWYKDLSSNPLREPYKLLEHY